MRHIILLAGALVAAQPLPVFAADVAQPAAAAAPAAAEVDLASLKQGPYRDDAMRLANITMPRGPFVAMIDAALVNGLRLGMKDGSAVLEKQAPGISLELEQAVSRAARPFLIKSYEETLRRYARLYSRSLDATETASLASFYQSPLGQKMIARKYGHIASPQFASEITASETTTAADVSKINRDVAKGLVDEMGAEDMKALFAFMAQPVFVKLKSLKPVVDRLEAEQANEDDPEMEQALAKAMADVLGRHKLGS